MVVLALAFGVAPEPAMAAPCPGHGNISGSPGHGHHGRQAGASHGAGSEAAVATADPAGGARGTDHDREAPNGLFYCHAASAAVFVSPPEIASRPRPTSTTVASWPHPPAAPAVGIYRPPALA